jgi:DNA-binding MarR family transcriptional regulator
MSERAVDELARLLFWRRECLEALREGGSAKRDLVERLDCSRSTLDRILRKPNEAGLVRYGDGVWSLTPVGRMAHATQERYLGSLDSLAVAAVVLDDEAGGHVPEAFLDDVDVIKPDPSVPDAVLESAYDGLGKADRVRGLATQTIGADTRDRHEAFASEPVTDLETVIDPSMFEQIRRLYPDLVEGDRQRVRRPAQR